jgi:broad specificity phosphatase PhoE
MKSGTIRLLLVRHGEVDANREFRYLGRRDDPLNRRGREQARRLAVALSEIPADSLIASPLLRTLATARAIAEETGLEVGEDWRLSEMDFGAWEGLSREELIATDSEARDRLERWERDPSVAPPGGESLDAVQRRVIDFADQLVTTTSGSTFILVSHVGPIKTLLCAALGVSLASTRRLFLDPATVSVIDWGEAPVVRVFNSQAHPGFGNARWLADR